MKKSDVGQKFVYVLLYFSSLIGWVVSLLYANIYYKITVNSNPIPFIIVVVILLIHWVACLKFTYLISKVLSSNSPKDIWPIQSILYTIAVILTVISGLRLVNYII